MEGKSETTTGPSALGLAKRRHPAPFLLVGLQREDHLMRFSITKLVGGHNKLTDC